MTLRRQQQLWYILADIISSELGWISVLGFRWIVYDGRMDALGEVLIPAFSFWPPLIIYPLVCLQVPEFFCRPVE